MTSLSDLSDAELEAIANEDHEGFTAAAAQRLGVRPQLALAVRSQESRGNPNAVSPKGARGQMQLMPGTAADLGVDIDDPYQNIEGGVRYLGQQINDFGDEDLGLAAYNAGPGAVRKYGGVPPYRETQDYVQGVRGRDISQASDDELMQLAGEGGPSPEVTVEVAGRPDLGVGVAHADTAGKQVVAARAAPTVPGMPRNLPQKQRPADDPTIAQDAWSGFSEPWAAAYHTAVDPWAQAWDDTIGRQSRGEKPVEPTRLDPMYWPKVGGALVSALPASVTGAFVRPAARAAGKVLPDPYVYDKNFLGIGYGAPRRATGAEKQGVLENTINTALSAAKPATPRPVALPKPRAMTLDELQTAKRAAYKAVEQSGVRYTPQGFADMVGDIQRRTTAGRMNPKRHEKAASMVEELQDMVAQGYSPTLTELDELRQVVRRDVANFKVDPAEKHFGDMIVDAMDDFVTAANGGQVSAPRGVDADALLKTARDLNTRYRKVEAVSNARESAAQRAGTTGSGGNIANATAQNVRRFTDPTSSKYMRNMTPEERKLAGKIVKPTKSQDALRLVGKLSPSGNGLMAALNLGATAANPAMGAVGLAGIMAKAAADGATAKKVEQLIRLMSMGGTRTPKVPPVQPMLYLAGRPAIPIRSAGGITGASAVAQLPQRAPSERPAQRSGSRARR